MLALEEYGDEITKLKKYSKDLLSLCASAKTGSFPSAHAAKALGRLQSQFVESVCAATMGAVRRCEFVGATPAFSAHATLHEHGILRCQDALLPATFLITAAKNQSRRMQAWNDWFSPAALLSGERAGGRRDALSSCQHLVFVFGTAAAADTHERAACVVPDYS